MKPDQAAIMAADLWQARELGRKIPFPDGLETEQDAYRIQDELIAAARTPPAGWKAGATGVGGPEALGLSGPFGGPLWAEYLHPVGLDEAHRICLPGLTGSYVDVEVEAAFRFGAAPQSSAPDDVQAAVDAAAIAIEITGSRFADLPSPPGRAFVADHAGNAAVALGAWQTGWRDLDLAGAVATLSVDGLKVATGEGRAVMASPFNALCWLVHHLMQRGHQLSAGQTIISGAIIPITPVPVGAKITAELTGLGAIHIVIEGQSGETSPVQ